MPRCFGNLIGAIIRHTPPLRQYYINRDDDTRLESAIFKRQQVRVVFTDEEVRAMQTAHNTRPESRSDMAQQLDVMYRRWMVAQEILVYYISMNMYQLKAAPLTEHQMANMKVAIANELDDTNTRNIQRLMNINDELNRYFEMPIPGIRDARYDQYCELVAFMLSQQDRNRGEEHAQL